MRRGILTLALWILAGGITLSAQVTARDSLPMVFQPDSLIRDSLIMEFETIQKYASDHAWAKQLYDLLFIPPARQRRVGVVKSENSEARFAPQEGKRINKIYIVILPPFGTVMGDSIYVKENLKFPFKTANSMHRTTAEWLVRRELTFREDYKVDPFELVQNEIQLKSLANIDDAIIVLNELAGQPDAVNLFVFCKDSFSWTVNASARGIIQLDLGVANTHLFGLAHSLEARLIYRRRWYWRNKDLKDSFGYRLTYKARNMAATRTNLTAIYEKTLKRQYLTVGVDRPFETETYLGFGADYERSFHSSWLYQRDYIDYNVNFKYDAYDAWMGYSFKLPERYSYNPNIYLSARYTAIRHYDRPVVTPDSNGLYYNTDTWLAAFTYRKLKYFRANLVYDFGRSEQIPAGVWGTVVGGYEINDFRRLAYAGTEWRYSWYDKIHLRYYAIYGGLGSYFDRNHWERAVIKGGVDFFTPLLPLGRFRHRIFFRSDYAVGLRRYQEEDITFERYHIRAFDSDSLQGNQRLTWSLSTTIFAPNMFWGTRSSLTLFCDGGWLTYTGTPLFSEKPYTGIGFILNLRNENFVVKNLFLRIGYYPRVPVDKQHFMVSLSTSKRGNYYDFAVKRPETIPYQ